MFGRRGAIVDQHRRQVAARGNPRRHHAAARELQRMHDLELAAGMADAAFELFSRRHSDETQERIVAGLMTEALQGDERSGDD